MKKIPLLILFQGVVSFIIGILFSQMSWLGKLGISLFHSEYKILKVWWKSALVVFGIQISLISIQWVIKKSLHRKISLFIIFIFLLGGIVGVYYTYLDFTHTYEHRILKDKFHMGGYLFWIGWIITTLFFLFTSGKKKMIEETLDD